MISLSGERILITGATGSVGGPVAVALAGNNDVTAIARFGDAAARERLEQAGVRCVAVDFERSDFNPKEVPGDYDVALHFAVAKTNDFDRDLAANVEALGFLMARVAGTARAFLHCSSTAVYEPDGHRRFVETDALGDNHRAFGFMPTYSISKIAAEAMARYGARANDLPTTIARLSVPYGDDFGWPLYQMHMLRGGMAIPVHVDAPSEYNPIHIDDIVAQLPALLAAASVPANVVNWAGDDIVSIEDWASYLAGIICLEAKFQPTTQTIASVACDVTKRASITGACTVSWKDGLARMAEQLRA
jgi:nucleoside-diphosphate-sugar epimerase